MKIFHKLSFKSTKEKNVIFNMMFNKRRWRSKSKAKARKSLFFGRLELQQTVTLIRQLARERFIYDIVYEYQRFNKRILQ